MHTIQLTLLQTPKITLDGTPVTLPFKKAEGLFYYLAVKKTISREQAASLFWASTDEANAKKNLRHAIYIIKKAFDKEIIVSPQKKILAFNPDISIQSDYDAFMGENRSELYRGEFLQGFSVKNAPEFEEWLSMERAAIRDTYLRNLYEYLAQLGPDSLSEAEVCFKNYTREDPLDERVYLIMMKLYQQNRLFHKGIKLYQELSKMLNAELRISPGKETAALYRELLNTWTEESTEENDSAPSDIIGRQKEIHHLTQLYHDFLSGRPAAVFLSGDNGVGKSYLLNHFLDTLEDDNCLVLRSLCFHQEKLFAFHPWNNIMMQLDRYVQNHQLEISQRSLTTITNLFPMFASSNPITHMPENVELNFNSRAIRNSILKLFTLIGKEIPIVLSFDNIHFMDSYSLELLSAMIRDQNPNIMIFGTHLSILSPDMQKYVHFLYKEHLVDGVEVHRFSKEAVRQLVEARFGENALNENLLRQIYKKTEGNAFFLETLLTQFTGAPLSNVSIIHTQNILSDRLLALSDDSRQILDIISLFHDYATLEIIEFITNRDTFEILSLLDELKVQTLIKETMYDNEIRFQFCHNKMQEFVHAQLSPSKRRLLHRRAADYMVQSPYPRTGYWYEKIIYHYTLCGDEPSILKYKILKLEAFSASTFDLYPILIPSVENQDPAQKKLTSTFENLKTQLYQLFQKFPNAGGYSELEAHLLYLMGKYYISQGIYAKGLSTIRQILSQNEYAKAHPQFHIQCLRQLTFYGIQIWDTRLMRQNIFQCMELEETSHLDIDAAIEYRLYGLLLSMEGSYEEAEDQLMKAISSFKMSPLKSQNYALNIAACYNYLGELYRKRLNFSAAIEYYLKAVRICTKRRCPISPTFYTNLSKVYLASGMKQASQVMLMSANELYDNSSTLMGRAYAKSSLSRIKADMGNWDSAIQLLLEAKECAARLASPYESGILALNQAALLYDHPGKFEAVIDSSISSLCQESSGYLKNLPGCYEIDELDRLTPVL